MGVITTNAPVYSVKHYGADPTTYSPALPVKWVSRATNIGYSDYLNDVPEAFFTLKADDPDVAYLRSTAGKGHLSIIRYDPVTLTQSYVFFGFFGTEVDSSGDDVIFYGHGYMSALYSLHTDWNQVWSTVTLNTIVSDLITRAKTGIANSPLNWATIGTIEAPATTSGGSTPIILPTYTAFYKRILFVMREMAAIGRSDTTNVVAFGFEPTATFRFWGNKGSDTNVAYVYGARQITGFRNMRQPGNLRNQILAVGSSPRDLLLRSEQSASVGSYGRRQEAVYFPWVRDQTELDRVARLRLAKGNREEKNIECDFFPGALIPPGHTFSPWVLGDRVRIVIDKGATNINSMFLIVGYQFIVTGGQEYGRLLLEDRGGS